MITNDPSRQVQSVRKSFRMLNFLQEMNGATLTELADHLGHAKSTVHNYLGTLESMGYVVNDDGTYRLGLRFLTHGIAAKNTLGIQNTVRRSLASISTDLAHPTWWVAEEFGRGFFLERSDPRAGTQIYGRLGKRSYLHTHAPGKAILAKLPPEDVEAITEYHGLPEQTMKTTTDLETLQSELESVQEQEYAISNGEAVLGVQSIGAAFRVPGGSIHAIGAFGYAGDLLGSNQAGDLSTLTDTVAELKATLNRGGDAHV